MPPEQTETVLGLVLGCSALVAIVAIVGGLLHSRSKRLMAHVERMKALDLGRELPGVRPGAAESGDGPARTPSERCYSIAGQAAFWGFVFAAGAGAQGYGNLGVSIAIAAATGAIGVTSVICGTVLAAKGVTGRLPEYASAPAKGYYEPDEV